jgi:hypothetical protein
VTRGAGWWQAPAWALLAAQAVLFLWMAPRGFEFTDEAYYLLNYLHWRELSATVTYFGFYFEGLFRLLGQSIVGMRVAGLVMLLASSAWFACALDAWLAKRGVPQAGAAARPSRAFIAAAGAAAGMSFFSHLSTLRAPAYNMLALCAALVSTGCLLRLMGGPVRWRAQAGLLAAYGLAVFACGLAKPTSGALLMAVHVALGVLAGGAWLRQAVVPLTIAAIAAATLTLVALSLLHPSWLGAVSAALVLMADLESRSVLLLARQASWELQRAAGSHGAWALAGLLLAGAAVRPAWRPRTVPVLVPLLLGSVCWLIVDEPRAELWWPAAAVVLGVLLVLARWGLAPAVRPAGDARLAAALMLLCTLPPALSFGTNMPVLLHSRQNAVFALLVLVAAVLLLQRRGLLGPRVAGLAIALTAVPGLAFQLLAATRADSAYRQFAALGAQQVPVRIGPAGAALRVDEATAETLDRVTSMARDAGFVPGQPVLDLTGDGPGLVYAVGGRPLGVAWLPGGYPGSDRAAVRLLGSLPEARLRASWLLTSDTNPRAIPRWQAALAGRLGASSHEQAGSVRVRWPYRWSADAPGTLDVQLWKPRTLMSSASGVAP